MDAIKMKIPTDVNDLVAERLRDCWAIHPRHTLGTCGWINGKPWMIWYTKRKPAHIPEVKDD